MRKLLIPLLLFLLLTGLVYSQSKPRTAVIPFNAIGVAEMESLTASNLFETALVQTESFLVIEQNQIAEILDAQSFTLSGCTDESCAIEIGKLLAAEQIILGSFSRVGSGYVINAKIIDVTLGRNIRAEKVEFSTMDDLSKSMDLLAYKLAGLTFREGGAETIATAFGELFISTDPAGADIFINGMKKGQSPDVISRIPLGRVLVEARQWNLYASLEVDVGTDMGKVDLVLKTVFGNLFIKSSEKQVSVFIDGKDLGALGRGLFENLQVGLHKLELIGKGLYFKEDIELIEATTVKIEAYPRKVGVLSYNFPPNVMATVTGRGGYTKKLAGKGSLLNLPAGEYTVKATGADYNPLEEKVTIEQSRTLSYTPQLEFSEEYFVQRLKELEDSFGMVSFYDIGDYVTRVDVLLKDLQESGYSFPAIETEIKELVYKAGEAQIEFSRLDKIQKLKEELAVLEQAYEKEDAAVLKRNIFKYVFGGLAAGSLGTSGASWVLGNTAYTNYENAVASDLAIEYRDQSQMYDVIKLSAGGAGIVFTALSLINWFKKDNRPELEQSIAALSAQIAELEAK